jgi:hypothetical protein
MSEKWGSSNRRAYQPAARTLLTFLSSCCMSRPTNILFGNQDWTGIAVPLRLKNRLTPICPTRCDLPFAFRLRAKKQQFGPVPPHAPQIAKTHPYRPKQGAKHRQTFGQNLGEKNGLSSTSTYPNFLRIRGNTMKMRHEPRGTNVGTATMKTGY